MGIHGLAKLIGDYAPSAVKENEIKNYFGRKVAIDASMSIYQFLIAVRQDGNVLTNDEGETTSHLMGIFYRTIRMVENGIKPVYVFDGKPPTMKSGELAKRRERREDAEKKLAEAQVAAEAGMEEAQENVEKFQKRLVKVTKQHNEECKQLLTLMGIPYIDAPCEAEAQCAEMVRSGKVYGAATEDMDSLTFSAHVLLRHMTFSEARKMPIQEFHLNKVYEELGLDREQFIDLCILMGCDYCESIKGVGPKRAIDLIRQYKSIEEILKRLDTKKYQVPEDWKFQEARELFRNPEVTGGDEIEMKWTEPDEEGLVEYMVKGKAFSEDRIRNGAKKLAKARKGSTQGRLDNFFTIAPSNNKRKSEVSKGPLKKKTKGSAGGKFKKPR